MNKTELIQRLQDIEWEDFEVKDGTKGLPKNIWETVSAFSNTVTCSCTPIFLAGQNRAFGYLQIE